MSSMNSANTSANSFGEWNRFQSTVNNPGLTMNQGSTIVTSIVQQLLGILLVRTCFSV
jgi:hypothetical protein